MISAPTPPTVRDRIAAARLALDAARRVRAGDRTVSGDVRPEHQDAVEDAQRTADAAQRELARYGDAGRPAHG